MKVLIEWENGQKHEVNMDYPNFMVENTERKMISKILIQSAPPKPLSDEEIHWIAQRFYHTGLGIDPVQFARAIEQKIRGEK
jgi:hypothetical protein